MLGTAEGKPGEPRKLRAEGRFTAAYTKTVLLGKTSLLGSPVSIPNSLLLKVN